MKLIIQIPCLNEEETLPVTLHDLPRDVEGFDTVEWLVIDDGSTDRTIEVAKEHGVDHIVRLTNNKGLASGFQAGLDAALKLGADVIVNTDADNQYDGGDVAKLVAPIVAGDADMVVGDRQVMTIEHFSPAKKALQQLGSWVVRQASQTTVPDTTSGFRAYNREAAIAMQVVSRFTYTLETIIQAGKMTVAIDHVPVRTNPKMRESRLFPSMWMYIRQRGLDLPHLRALRAAARVHDRRGDRRLRRARRLGALLLLLGGRRRQRPRAVADPRRGAVQRRHGARGARRARRSDQRPADHAAAHLRARAPGRAGARRAAVALRAGQARERARADHGRPRRRPRQGRGPRGRPAVSATVTRDAEGTVTGNTYDKYGSTNPVVRRLMATFQRTLGDLFERVDPASVLDVGCGEAILTHQWAVARPATRVVGFDLEDPEIQRHWQQRTAPNLEYRILRAQEPFPFADGEFALATAIEVLEHVPDPDRALAEMARCARDGHLLVSVPREPLWRVLNMARGAYVNDLGNTPGHLNHWSRRRFEALLSRHGEVVETRSPFPWTMVLTKV